MRTLGGERRGSLLAAIDRTVTAAGSRLLAQRLAAPLTDPAAIAQRHDAVAHFVADAGRARRDARSAARRARSRPRAVAAGGRPRRPARPRRHPRRHRRRRRASPPSSTAAATCPPRSRRPRRALRQPDAAIARELTAALGDELPLSQARRRLRARGLRRRARRSARAARRIAPGDRGAAGALCRGDRRARAEGAAQQRARLFRRGDGAARATSSGRRRSTRTFIHRRRWPARCASPPPSWASWRRRSPAPPTARSASSSRPSTGWRRR